MTTAEFAYPARLSRNERGGWDIRFRDLPDAISSSRSGEDGVAVAEGCLQATIEGRLEEGSAIPPPSQPRRGEVLVTVPIETATKAALFNAVAASGTTRIALAKAVGLDEKEIRRMLDPRHASKLPRVALVLKALGKELRVSVVDAPKPPAAGEPRPIYRVGAKQQGRKRA